MGTRPTDSFRRQRSIRTRKPSYLCNSDHVECRLLHGRGSLTPYGRARLPPTLRFPRVRRVAASALSDPPTRGRVGCVPGPTRASVGPGVVHGRAR